MVQQNQNFDLRLTDRQELAWRLLNSWKIKSVLYGGAKGGGKSFLLCWWVYMFCNYVIKTFDLVPTNKPLHIGWIGRKQATDFTATTLQTWQRIIPPSDYRIVGATEKHPKHILIKDTIAVDFGGLDKRDDINKFNSAEYAFFCIDQAEEVTKDEVSVLRGSLRLTIDGQELPYKELYSANPANCWLKPDFILTPAENFRFVQALPSDNPHLPSSYIDTLKDAFGHRQELLDAYLYGSWDLSDNIDQIIKSVWIEKAGTFERIKFLPETRKFITVDVARYGDCETVCYYMEDTDIVEELIYGQRGIDYTVNRLTAWSKEHNDCPVIVDEGGIGGGVVDLLGANGVDVIGAMSAEKPVQTNPMYRYGNKRAEVWDYCARAFSRGDVELHWPDQKLKTQLCIPHYKYKNSRVYVESKEEITKRLGAGTSPDRADAYVNGLYYSQTVSPTGKDGKTIGITSAKGCVPDYIGI